MTSARSNLHSKLFVIITIMTMFDRGMASCYFPLEYLGEFLSQSMTSREIAYTSVSVMFDSIPAWGSCHKRIGSQVILTSPSHQNPNRDCFKCINIVLRSPNVLQVHTNNLDKCYSSEEAAFASCPTRQEIRERKATEMMLYKTRGFYGGSSITRTYCPLNGRFKFTYSINDGTEDDLECHEPVSEAGDCPSRYKFDLHFRGCSFPNFDMSFQCLASWPGENGETYMSLLDTKLPQLGEEARPRYRCALFKEDPDTGLTHVALSSDSTCTNHLYSSQDGYETLHMERVDPPPPPHNVAEVLDKNSCVFPQWMQGKWEGLTINGDEFTYRDEANFVTYKGKCLQSVDESEQSGLKFLLYLQTDCGSPTFNCALFQRRDTNIMEFQLGVSSSTKPSNGLSLQLCSAENFSPGQWVTLGRMQIEEPPRCPLSGEFTGVLPDAEGLCARSYADCNNPEVMFYTVFNCNNTTEVYEEREYLCYGQWIEEETGLVYTYTERRDIPGKECFVGTMLDGDHYIITEAGQNCERGHQPRKYGMTLKRVGLCNSPSGSSEEATTTQISTLNHEKQSVPPRPVSPKFSSVPHTQTTSSSVAMDVVVHELDENGDEQDLYEKETVNRHTKHRTSPKKVHKHHNSHFDPSDILTNAIEGSSSSARTVSSTWSLIGSFFLSLIIVGFQRLDTFLLWPLN